VLQVGGQHAHGRGASSTFLVGQPEGPFGL